jgi:hypothetical protein
MRVEVLGEEFDAGPDAFLDTAAAVASMDLVIWRWLLERDDSPWYPGHRLFRQKQRGAWDDVFRRMHEALR